MTFRFVLRVAKVNQAGKAPVCLCISAGGKRAYCSTSIRLDPAAWDVMGERQGGSTDAAKLNNNTLSVIKAEAIALMQSLPAAQRTAHRVAAALRGTAPGAQVCLLKTGDATLATHFASRNVSTLQNFTRALQLLRTWHKASTLPQEQFDEDARKRFVAWLLNHQALSPSSVRSYLSGLAALWARAGLMTERGRGPFAGLKLPRHRPEPRASLSRQQFARLATGGLPTGGQHEARNLYLACFYLHGSRIGVVLQLRWGDVREGRVYYRAAKGGPHKSVAVSGPLRALLGESGPADGFVFDYLPSDFFALDKAAQHRAIKRANTKVNWHLRAACRALDLPGNIHPHTARHTMARMTVEATGDIRAAQHVLGHSTYQQTEVYVRSMLTEEVDAAAASVYDSL
ncbi:tyrosine-type recombinase/integrase [Hymenobacter psychrophilus]|nr:tyrosine-type recombinase/integrase [Hymenobacter psychrophilus]